MSDPCPADILMSDPHRGWVTKSSREKVPGTGDTETRSSYKVKVGEGDTDRASDEEHRGAVTAAIPHPSDIIMSDPHRGKVPGAGGTDEASDEEHRGPCQ